MFLLLCIIFLCFSFTAICFRVSPSEQCALFSCMSFFAVGVRVSNSSVYVFVFLLPSFFYFFFPHSLFSRFCFLAIRLRVSGSLRSVLESLLPRKLFSCVLFVAIGFRVFHSLHVVQVLCVSSQSVFTFLIRRIRFHVFCFPNNSIYFLSIPCKHHNYKLYYVKLIVIW